MCPQCLVYCFDSAYSVVVCFWKLLLSSGKTPEIFNELKEIIQTA